MRNLAIIILALAFIAPSEAAEGRRTAFLGGVVVGILGSVVAHDMMEAKPATATVVVEEAPRRVVYVEAAPQVVYVERSPRVVYVEEAPRRVVYVERHEDRREHNGFGWTAPIARPFPQGRGR